MYLISPSCRYEGNKSLRIGSRCMEAMVWQIKAPRGDLIVILGDVYRNINIIEDRLRGGNGYRGGSSSDSYKIRYNVATSLERQYHKFWVENDNLIDITFMSIKEVPLVVFGKGSNYLCKYS